MLVSKLIYLNDQYVNFKRAKKSGQNTLESSRKISKKSLTPKNTHKLKDQSETNSEMSQEEYFERQHKDHPESSNII